MSQEPHIIADEHTDEAPKASNSIVRGAIIVAIIVVLLFIALAIVKFVPKLISSIGTANVSFSSLFSPKDGIAVTAPSEVKSGDSFTVSWKNTTTTTDGSLMWSYKCVDGVTVEYASIGGQRPVVCETMFPLPTTSNSYSFVAKNTNKANTPITMTVALWDKDMKNIIVQNSANMTILAPGNTTTVTTNNQYNPDYNATTTVTTNNNGVNTNANPSPSNNTQTNNTNHNTGVTNGTADLSVSLVKVGRTQSDGSYVNSSSFAENDRVTVQFKVSNVGTARSGAWTLRANLPTKTVADQTYTSSAQPALNPGDSYIMTISFDAFDPNGRNIAIILNANDTNQSNNTLNIPVTSNGSYSNNNSYNNNYNNNSGYYNGNNNYNNGGNTDLVVRIVDVGVMNNNNQFYYSNSLSRNDKVAVKFEIQNIGGQTSGPFQFTANLPTYNNSLYQSNTENSLAPGETRQYTIGFTNPTQGNGTVSFTVDSNNSVYETNEGNNYASRTINVN
ncbi:MAG: Peptidase sortase-like protein [Candidatus Taylorbacteria bacterium]|nr:Peptidase sortase-like protein [Candidatus Taylorbacteria bacterium]